MLSCCVVRQRYIMFFTAAFTKMSLSPRLFLYEIKQDDVTGVRWTNNTISIICVCNFGVSCSFLVKSQCHRIYSSIDRYAKIFIFISRSYEVFTRSSGLDMVQEKRQLVTALVATITSLLQQPWVIRASDLPAKFSYFVWVMQSYFEMYENLFKNFIISDAFGFVRGAFTWLY